MIPPTTELDAAVARAADLLRPARRVVVLTGAGISAESGVPTFRDADGLWEGHRVEEVATPDAFDRDPELVWRFYNLRRANLRTVEPNPGHFALVKLEDRHGDGFTLVTQNVDGLHRRAGSRRVLELHGNIARTRCTNCGDHRDRGLDELGPLPECPLCGGRLRPDIVWFTESLPVEIWAEAEAAAMTCDAMIVAGTSAVVYPAAGLIATVAGQGKPVIEVNTQLTAASRQVTVSLFGPSGVVLPKLVERL